jgi:hypothetical protein
MLKALEARMDILSSILRELSVKSVEYQLYLTGITNYSISIREMYNGS